MDTVLIIFLFQIFILGILALNDIKNNKSILIIYEVLCKLKSQKIKEEDEYQKEGALQANVLENIESPFKLTQQKTINKDTQIINDVILDLCDINPFIFGQNLFTKILVQFIFKAILQLKNLLKKIQIQRQRDTKYLNQALIQNKMQQEQSLNNLIKNCSQSQQQYATKQKYLKFYGRKKSLQHRQRRVVQFLLRKKIARLNFNIMRIRNATMLPTIVEQIIYVNEL